MRDFVVRLREKIRPEVPNLSAPELNPSAQALVLWKNRQWAATRRSYDSKALQIDGFVTPATEEGKKAASYNRVKVKTKTREVDADLNVPSDPVLRAKHEAACASPRPPPSRGSSSSTSRSSRPTRSRSCTRSWRSTRRGSRRPMMSPQMTPHPEVAAAVAPDPPAACRRSP